MRWLRSNRFPTSFARPCGFIGLVALTLGALLLSAGCGDDGESGTGLPAATATRTAVPPSATSPPTPTPTRTSVPPSATASATSSPTATRTPAPAVVVRSQVEVAGDVPPANPVSLADTPTELNRSRAVSYQLAGVEDASVQRFLLLVPGFLGGAGSFDYLGRRVVERSGGRVAVWAMDRRSNALEDQTGLDAAERDADPEVAKGYYFQGAEVDGKTFAGFLSGSATELSYISEWGISSLMADIDALLNEAERRYPNAAVFLGGHSLGGSIAPIYAAWDFGDRAGFERLSGLVLLEGGPSPAGPAAIPSQQDYEVRGVSNGLGSASLATLRTGDPTSTLPFIGRDLFVAAQIGGMRASPRFGAPEDISPDADIIGSFYRLLFGLIKLPAMTNETALGFGFDDDFQPLSFVRVAIGQTDGPVQTNTSLVAQIFGADTLAPSDAEATYAWMEGSEQEEPEPTDIGTFGEVLFSGPSDFIEWYFPARLTLDVSMVSSLNVQPEGDWRKDVYGMAVTENARVDVPVFAVGGDAGLASDIERFFGYRDSISATLRDGTLRVDSMGGFVAAIAPRYAHLDPLTARDEGEGNLVFGPLVDWMETAAAVAPRR